MKLFFDSRSIIKMLATLGLAIAILPLNAAPLIGESSNTKLRGEYQRLKQRFEMQIKASSDPKVTSCLSAETAAASWLLVAANLAPDNLEKRKWLTKVASIEDIETQSKNWESSHVLALELYYESMIAIIGILSSKTGQLFMLTELEQVVKKTEDQLAALEDKDERALEKRVILSGTLVSLMSIMVKIVGGGPMNQPAQNILNNVAVKADYISRRPDFHYRAKLSILYVNNVQGLTALVFLLSQNAGKPLSDELALIHGNLNQHGANLNLPEIMGITWVAQAQGALPVGYWLATNY